MNRPIREVNAQLKRLRGALLQHPKYLSGDEKLNGLSAKDLIDAAILVLDRIKDDTPNKQLD